MKLKSALIGVLIGSAIGTAALMPCMTEAQDAKVKTAMELLKSMAGKLGAPKIEGTDPVAGKHVPAIYFGSTKMNNNFDLVDAVVKQVGGTATIFVKNGDEYARVATNVKKDEVRGPSARSSIQKAKRSCRSGTTRRSTETSTSSANLTRPATTPSVIQRTM